MAIGKVLVSLITFSFFFIISALYSVGVGVAKIIYFKGLKKTNNNITIERQYYLRMGFVLMITSIIYITYMIRLYFYPSNFNYGEILAIAIAFISFLELGFSIRGLLKSNRNNDLLLSGLKSVNLASSLTSIVLTQVALLSFTMTNTNPSNYNALAGIVFGSVCILISIVMFFNYLLKKHIT